MENLDFMRMRQILAVLQAEIKTKVVSLDAQFRPGKMDFSQDAELRSFGWNDTWGGRDCDAWFRFQMDIPPELDGKTVRFHLETGREGLWNAVNPQFLAYVNGAVVCGMDTNHQEFPLGESGAGGAVHAGEHYQVDLDAWSGMVTKPTANAHGNGNEPIWTRASLWCVDTEVESLYWDLNVPYDAAAQLIETDYRRIRILQYLIGAVNLLDLRMPGSPAFHESVCEARKYLRDTFYGAYCGNTEGEADCLGHTHIDVAWQWTYAHTRRKAARSFATVINLMERYPQYRFLSSQPQLYEFVKEDNPALYEQIRKQVAAGNWEAEGGMWVEADCNLTSGESLIRQFLYGKHFFQKEFGVDSRVLWLPDVFGYSAALPQICKKCGIDYFVTSKLSWNDTNKFPYDTFRWRGIDGTELLSHFISTRDYVGHPVGDQPIKSRVTAYNGILEPKQVMGGWERYQQKELNSNYLLTYGYGDGGGGTTYEMLEQAKRMEYGIPGCPTVKHEKSLEFLQGLEQKVKENRRLPYWQGELYLEFHRGTYTSAAKNKRNNRRAEFAAQQAEVLSALVQTLLPDTAPNPQDSLSACWKNILLNQFHDVLPGSSIQAVYEDTDRIYADTFAKLRYVSEGAKARIAAGITRQGSSLIVWNPLGYKRSGYVQMDWPRNYSLFHLEASDGTPLAVQRTFDGHALFYAPDIPGMGYSSFRIRTGDLPPEHRLAAEPTLAENEFLRIRFDEAGRLFSIWDREVEREILPEGMFGNQLETYEDRPHCYDAWEIEPYHTEKKWLLEAPDSFELLETGPHRAVYRFRYHYLESTLEQLVVLYARSRRIDFVTAVDWHQRHILLKAAFPTNILSDTASFEIQFGAVERPTHYNTAWDAARFETCAQKWADLSEDGYGVSLLNDCKYGYDIHDGTMRLSLIKAATFPNPTSDQGRHEFTYSLLPHPEGWRAAGVTRQAYDLNEPLTAQFAAGSCQRLPSHYSLLDCAAPNINSDTLKPAEDGDGYILRLYEAFGRRTKTILRLNPQLCHVWECDMLENRIQELPISPSGVALAIQPFEIKTLRYSIQAK